MNDVEDCPFCQGTGEGQTEYTSCRACRGKGYTRVITMDEDAALCELYLREYVDVFIN